MKTKEISATLRDSFGKGSMRRLRSAGITPGVVYSAGEKAVPLQFETKLLYTELLDIQGSNAVFTLKLDDGSEKNTIIKEIQTDPVNDTLYHTDFFEIDLKKPTQFTVPITFAGKAKGLELGGILRVSSDTLELKGEPMNIPDDCVVDITDMAIGDSLAAADIPLPNGVVLVDDADMLCVAIGTP